MNKTAEEQLRELASKHLGKAGDGTVVKAYVTPTSHDSSLLVPLPRSLNRKKSGIVDTSFLGYEVWHAYEMSFLLETGMPRTGILRVYFPCMSPNMIESKSFKLYLNSFDLEKFESARVVESIIARDLSEAAGGHVFVRFHEASECEGSYTWPLPEIVLFRNADHCNFNIEKFTEDSSLLELDEVYENSMLTFRTSNLRSNCEITNQKDTGNCFIMIRGYRKPTFESLTKYIFSFRDSQHFHENTTEIIYNTLKEMYDPEELLVANLYNRRGGLDIHSVRADSLHTLSDFMEGYHDVNVLFDKTAQQ